ncbi:MAG: autotransporter-associated beta strand repeat-containing protein [Chthoniobacteraceae bacterium]
MLGLLSGIAQADNFFIWTNGNGNNGVPGGGDNAWTNRFNWQLSGTIATSIPSSPGDTAVFSGSSGSNGGANLNGSAINISGVDFQSGASSGVGVLVSSSLFLSSGIFNSSGVSHKVDLTSTGMVELSNSATVGAQITSTNQGLIIFKDSANSGGISIINTGGTTEFHNSAFGGVGSSIENLVGGSTNFYDTSNAGAVTITNASGGQVNFNINSNAGSANITNTGGTLNFNSNSSAASATIINQDNSASVINFNDASTMGSGSFAANITNGLGSTLNFNANSSGSGGNIVNYNQVNFNANSTAGSAQITNHANASINFNDFSNAGSSNITNSSGTNGHGSGGLLSFSGNADAGNANIQNNANGAVSFSNFSTADSANILNAGGSVDFYDSSNAGGRNSKINNSNGGATNFHNTSSVGKALIMNTTGGMTIFQDSSSAGKAILVNYYDDNVSTPSTGIIAFTGSSTADNAIVGNYVGGIVDISGLATAGIAIGSIGNPSDAVNSTAGDFYLGSKNLAVGGLGNSFIISGVIHDGGHFGGSGGGLIKLGSGTMTLSGQNTYIGGTTIDAGTVKLDASTGSIAAGTALTFGGRGAFNYDNTSSAGSKSQGFGALAFGAGEGTVTSTLGGASNATLTFSSLARTTGATGNFVINGGSSATNKIVITGQGTGFINAGVFYGGGNYAAYDSGGFVRGINYGSDADSFNSTGGAAITGGTPDAGSNVLLQGAITGQTTASINTLNLNSNNLTLNASQTLTLNGILESGGSATINGGAGSSLQVGSSPDLVIRTDLQADTLTINAAIINTSTLTKSGAGTLILNGGYTGGVFIDNGGFSTSGTINGDVTISNGSTFGGRGTVNGSLTVSAGATIAPGDPQITTVTGDVSIASGNSPSSPTTALFSIANTRNAETNPVSGNQVQAGTDYDQVSITGSNSNLTIGGTNTTLQLNLSGGGATMLAQHAASASNPYIGVSNSTHGVNTNTSLDNYFVFRLNGGTTTGQFTTLTITDGLGDTLTAAILYGDGRFTDAGIGDVTLTADGQNGDPSSFNGITGYSQEFAISYTGNFATNSTTGGSDIVLTAIPEPSAYAMVFCGIGVLIVSGRLRRRTGVKNEL